MLDERLEMVREYRTFDEMFTGIEEYEKQLARQKEQSRENKQGVTLTTMHSAKGLEYDVVFIIEANEGLIPHKRSCQPEELEEERRMFYVAMTRARKHLHIYSLSELFGKAAEPSRFLGELLTDQISSVSDGV